MMQQELSGQGKNRGKGLQKLKRTLRKEDSDRDLTW